MGAIRVLLVDDDPFIRDLFATSLETAGGFQVVGEAGDAGTAVEIAARVEPDVILLDHMMPGRTGIDALPELKRLRPEVRVVVVSSADVADDARAAGADLFVSKPQAARDLAAVLREVVALA